MAWQHIDLGKLIGRNAQIERGEAFVTEALSGGYRKSVPALTFLIEGFKNFGAWTAKLILEKGGIIVVVDSVTPAIKNANGIDILALLEHRYVTDSLKDFQGDDDVINLNGLVTHERFWFPMPWMEYLMEEMLLMEMPSL